MGIKGSNKSRTVQQGAGTQNIPNSCVLNHCLLITKNKERNRSRPGTQSSPPTSTCHVLQKGAGGGPSSTLLIRDSNPGRALTSYPAPPPPRHTSTPPWTQALLGRKASAGRLRHSSPPPLSRARRPQLWSSCGAQPSHRLVPCQRQEAGKGCARLRDTGEGWTPEAGARPGSVITVCGREPTGELCR